MHMLSNGFHVPGVLPDDYIAVLNGGNTMTYEPKVGDVVKTTVDGTDLIAIYAEYDASRAVPQIFLYGEGPEIGERIPQKITQEVMRNAAPYQTIGAEGISKVVGQASPILRQGMLEELLAQQPQKRGWGLHNWRALLGKKN